MVARDRSQRPRHRHAGAARGRRRTRAQSHRDGRTGRGERHRGPAARQDPQVSGDRPASARQRRGRDLGSQGERGRGVLRLRHRRSALDDEQRDPVQDSPRDGPEPALPRLHPGHGHRGERAGALRGRRRRRDHRRRGRRRGSRRAPHRDHPGGAGPRVGATRGPAARPPAARPPLLRRRLAARARVRGAPGADAVAPRRGGGDRRTDARVGARHRHLQRRRGPGPTTSTTRPPVSPMCRRAATCSWTRSTSPSAASRIRRCIPTSSPRSPSSPPS